MRIGVAVRGRPILQEARPQVVRYAGSRNGITLSFSDFPGPCYTQARTGQDLGQGAGRSRGVGRRIGVLLRMLRTRWRLRPLPSTPKSDIHRRASPESEIVRTEGAVLRVLKALQVRDGLVGGDVPLEQLA